MQYLIQHYIDDFARVFPHNVAIRCVKCGDITYAEFVKRANKVATCLKNLGIEPGDRIVIFTEKTANSLIAFLGTLKADAVYIPIYDRSPAKRLSSIVNDSQARAVICDSATTPMLMSAMRQGMKIGTGIILDDFSNELSSGICSHFSFASDVERQPSHFHDYKNTTTDLAHILYTSGSTGAPKGVQITHRNVRQYVDWAVAYFGIEHTDKILNTAPLNFDMSTFDIYAAQGGGATICLAGNTETIFPDFLIRRIENDGVTIWKAVPWLLRNVLEVVLNDPRRVCSLRHLIFSGDLVTPNDLISWNSVFDRCNYYVGYGPTEATGMSSCYKVDFTYITGSNPVPIGIACAGKDIRVLNADGMNTVKNEIGEIYIGGEGISPGYWNSCRLSAHSFVKDYGGLPPGKMYFKSGDRGHFDDKGLLYFVGRNDDQVKVQGFRIELTEIELTIRSIGGVKDVGVIVHQHKMGDKILIAAIELMDGMDPNKIAALVRERLPSYAVPRRFKVVSKIPRTERGKVDRDELRRLVDSTQ